MKAVKILSLILAAILLIPPVNVSCSAVSDNANGKTSKGNSSSAYGGRYLIEFEELATKRLFEISEECEKEFHKEYDINLIPATIHFDYPSTCTLLSTFGFVTIRKSDYCISEIALNWPEVTDDEDREEISIMECIAAISALEYDDFYDKGLKTYYDYGLLDYKSAANMAAYIFSENIAPKLDNATQQSLDSNGKSIKVYSGKYSYYIYAVEMDGSVQAGLYAKLEGA